jgi:hypothetical protein
MQAALISGIRVLAPIFAGEEAASERAPGTNPKT